MTLQQFNQHFARLRQGFSGQDAPCTADEYFDLLGDWTAATFGRVVDKVLRDRQTIPYPSDFEVLLNDLTYWDVVEFFADWNHAYFTCTGEIYDGCGLWPPDPDPPEHMRKWMKERRLKADLEEGSWSIRKSELQQIVRDKGGRAAVRKELKEFADRGLLVNRTMTDYLTGRITRHEVQLGYRKPTIPEVMPSDERRAILRQFEDGMKGIPAERVENAAASLRRIREQARREEEKRMETNP